MSGHDIDAAGLHWICSDQPASLETVGMLLLHGAGGSARHWTGMTRFLPTGVPWAAVDLPGHGKSPGRTPLTIDEAAERIEASARHLGLTGPLAVVAHSIGGLVALLLATRWPHRVSQLALISTAARIRIHPELLRQLSVGEPNEAFIRESFSSLVDADQFAVVMDDLRRVRIADTGDFMAVEQCDMTPQLAEITASTIVIVARGDRVVSPRRSRALAAAIPRAELSVLDGGHYLHIERPNEVASLVLRLIGVTPAVNVLAREDPL